MQAGELIAQIEHTAPLALAAVWDHSGIQIAARRTEIFCLAVCLDPTPDAIRTALAHKADMVLSHHPLQLTPCYLDTLDALHEVFSLLLGADVALYAAHTSLDSNPAGPVTWLARELKLRTLRVLEPVAAPRSVESPLKKTGEADTTGYGLGVVGDLPEPLDPQALCAMLEPWLNTATLAGPELPLQIRRVAICPGSGGSLLKAAAMAGADVLITGDIKYHTALESPISALDVGHFALEEEMMRRFATELGTRLPVLFIPGRDPLRVLYAPPRTPSVPLFKF